MFAKFISAHKITDVPVCGINVLLGDCQNFCLVTDYDLKLLCDYKTGNDSTSTETK
jgi:DsbC/DsbD-like thiol-disulfide interchange protein